MRAHFSDQKPNRTGFVIGLAALAALAWGLYWKMQTAPTVGRQDANLAQQFLQIERQTAQWDATVWSNEIAALQIEESVIDLWDNLRSETNGLTLLRHLSFDNLTFPVVSSADKLAHDLEIHRPTGAITSFNPTQWAAQLDSWIDQGYQLDQSEWRHIRFDPSAQRSRFHLVAHLQRKELGKTEQRLIIEADLDISWLVRSNTAVRSGTISATNLVLMTGSGSPGFSHALQIKLGAAPPTVDPALLVYDLDRDGDADLVLPTHNQVFRNKGAGKFEVGTIHSALSSPPHASTIADFDGDGWPDLLCADPVGLRLFPGSASGSFGNSRVVWTAPSHLNYVFVLAAGDIDQDGDLDLYLVQYKQPYVAGQMPTPYYDANDGFPSYLLANDGRGVFRDVTAGSGLEQKRFRRTYSCSFADLNGDHALDLLVVSDFAGADLFYNDGKGNFTDTTAQALGENHGFGMAHAFADFNQDGRLDFVMMGMNSAAARRLDQMPGGIPRFAALEKMRSPMTFGNRLFLGGAGGFTSVSGSAALHETGWSWGAAAFDFDNDGLADLFVANGHQSRRTARDYESRFWRHDIYLGDSRHDPVRETYFRSVATRLDQEQLSYGGYDKNRLVWNRGSNSFLEIGYPMGVALEEDSRNVVANDLDGDGRVDLLVTTDEVWPERRQVLHVFRNLLDPTNHWIGIRFKEQEGSRPVIGTRVLVQDSHHEQIKQIVTGDSFRSQHPAIVHFGLGRESSIRNALVIWPNGETNSLGQLVVDRYHDVVVPARIRPAK